MFSLLFAAFCLLVYFYLTRNFQHWAKKNVDFLKPFPLFGNAFKVFIFRENVGEFARNIYRSTSKAFIGFFVRDEPYLLIREPDLIKAVLVKDFAIFNDRSVTENMRVDPMGSQLMFLLKNPHWRGMRRKVTPVFTSGKMRAMYPLINEAGKGMITHILEETRKNPVVDMRDISAKYTTDAISSTSFGIDANSFHGKSEFRAITSRVFNWAIWERVISTSYYFVAPTIVKVFKLRFVDKPTTDFLRDTFWKMMNEREQSGHTRNDLLDTLIEIRSKEDINDPNKLDGDRLVAQATQFLIAGFETTSSTISFTLYELALNKSIQDRLRAEIVGSLKQNELTYDSLNRMQYLDCCIKETLRKYPPLAFLDRRCNQDYTIPDTGVVLEKGQAVFISIWGLHYDPQYFANPDQYDPGRFSEENSQAIQPFTYLPFGEGPRNCIGARFGTISSKSGIVHIISQFEVELCDEKHIPIKLDNKGILLAPKDGLYLRFKKI